MYLSSPLKYTAVITSRTPLSTRSAGRESCFENRLRALENENSRFEIDLEKATLKLEEAGEKLKDQEKLFRELKKTTDNPEPPCDFGQKGQKWSYKVPIPPCLADPLLYLLCPFLPCSPLFSQVFGLACELLCLRFTAQQCQRVTEVFLRFLYPNKKLRVPSSKTFEKWRSMMYPIVQFVNVKVPPPPSFTFPSLPTILCALMRSQLLLRLPKT